MDLCLMGQQMPALGPAAVSILVAPLCPLGVPVSPHQPKDRAALFLRLLVTRLDLACVDARKTLVGSTKVTKVIKLL
jgi:hypothetical protein